MVETGGSPPTATGGLQLVPQESIAISYLSVKLWWSLHEFTFGTSNYQRFTGNIWIENSEIAESISFILTMEGWKRGFLLVQLYHHILHRYQR